MAYSIMIIRNVHELNLFLKKLNLLEKDNEFQRRVDASCTTLRMTQWTSSNQIYQV